MCLRRRQGTRGAVLRRVVHLSELDHWLGLLSGGHQSPPVLRGARAVAWSHGVLAKVFETRKHCARKNGKGSKALYFLLCGYIVVCPRHWMPGRCEIWTQRRLGQSIQEWLLAQPTMPCSVRSLIRSGVYGAVMACERMFVATASGDIKCGLSRHGPVLTLVTGHLPYIWTDLATVMYFTY